MRSILEAVILGATQGATEFIPVSSSGHLILVNQLFNFETGGFVFDAILNIGTLLALFLYFRKEVWGLCLSVLNPQKWGRMGWYVIAATIPAALTGWFLGDFAEAALRSVYVVVAMLGLVGVLMLLVDKRVGERTHDDISLKDTLIIGFAQVLAFIPGTSRSGITIVAGVSRNLSRETAARFSFLLAMPILSGGVAKVITTPGVSQQVIDSWVVFAAGVGASFISGYLAVGFLMRYLNKTHSLSVFVWYRIGLAAIILLVNLF